MVRAAVAADAEAVAEVWLRSRAASVPAIPAPVHTDEQVRAWFAQMVLPVHEVWIEERPGSGVVALLVLDRDWVDQLYVDPDWVARGIGTRLVEVAKQRRPGGLQLWVFETNLGARRFYERHGFVAVETTPGDNEEGAPDVRYAWRPSIIR